MNDLKVDPRIEQVCSDLTYEIATGEFQPEQKLPSVREAVERWQIDHRLVLKAYRKLAEVGLVKCVPRSGYFVAVGTSHEVISKHRFELEAMFEQMSVQVSEVSNLSILGTFRYFANLAEIRAREKPECVFIECTAIQAGHHAEEVTSRLAVPCLAMTIDQIEGKQNRIPSHVKTLLTTAFHSEELVRLRSSKRFNVLSVPIEVSPELKRPLKGEQAVIIEADESQAEHMSSDVQPFLSSVRTKYVVSSDIHSTLQDLFETRSQGRKDRAYLSPRLWGRITEDWREHSKVELIRFRISESAWTSIADAIALPLGAIPSRMP